MKKSLLTLLALGSLALLPLKSHAQTTSVPPMANTFKICSEGACSIVTMPVGTVYQYGTGSTWVPAATSTATSPTLPLFVSYPAFGFDPAPGAVKQFNVQQTAAPYTVTWKLNGVITVTTVPALVPPAPPAPTAYTPTFTPGTVYPATWTSIAAIPTSAAADLLAMFPLPPFQFYAGILQNFTSNFNLGGVNFNCTYGGMTTAGAVNLNCVPVPIVPVAATTSN